MTGSGHAVLPFPLCQPLGVIDTRCVSCSTGLRSVGRLFQYLCQVEIRHALKCTETVWCWSQTDIKVYILCDTETRPLLSLQTVWHGGQTTVEVYRLCDTETRPLLSIQTVWQGGQTTVKYTDCVTRRPDCLEVYRLYDTEARLLLKYTDCVTQTLDCCWSTQTVWHRDQTTVEVCRLWLRGQARVQVTQDSGFGRKQAV